MSPANPGDRARRGAQGARLPAAARDELLLTLRVRFGEHPERHPGIAWAHVETRLASSPDRLWSLHEMERSGGEPDVVFADAATGVVHVVDCSPESPSGRRSVCFDDEALASRKQNKPRASALGMAAAMGIELLTEAEYRHLQSRGAFDQKTSSWVQTPSAVRARGGALFCDSRYGMTFTYHNGAESYYAARGFRGVVRI